MSVNLTVGKNEDGGSPLGAAAVIESGCEGLLAVDHVLGRIADLGSGV